jgi:hypothetical protein
MCQALSMESAIGLHTIYGPCLAALRRVHPLRTGGAAPMLLQGKAHGEQCVWSLLHPTGRQSARQQRVDIRAPHIEQVR